MDFGGRDTFVQKKHMQIFGRISLVFSFLFLLYGCDKFESSPNEIPNEGSPQNINASQIQKLLSNTQTNDTIRIVFTGDSQRYYDEAELLVKKVNELPNIDFLIVAGDLTDFGLYREFEWVNDIFSRLTVPYICVIGNHDVLGNGRKTYMQMYGETDFSFVYKRTKFIVLNTNSREYGFNGAVPNIKWLQEQCKPEPGVDYIVPVSHVQPYHKDFDKNLEKPYAQTLENADNVLISLHGHAHVSHDFYPYEDGIRYLNSNSVERRLFFILEIYNGEVHKIPVSY